VVAMAVEIPTSAVSDYFGARKVMIFGILSYLAGYVVILFKRNFFTFCIFYGAYGLYETFLTGSKESIMRSNMLYFGITDSRDIARYKNKAKIIHYASLGLAAFLAKQLLKFNSKVLILIDMVVLTVYVMVVITMNDRENKHIKKLNSNYMKTVKSGFQYLIKHYSLRKLLLLEAVRHATLSIFINYSSLLFEEIGKGMKFAEFMVPIEIWSAALMQKILINFFIEKKNIYLDTLLLLVSGLLAVGAMHIYQGIFSYVLIILYFFCMQSADLLLSVRMHEMTPLKSQSVIASISSFMNSICKLILLRLLGHFSQAYSYKTAFYQIVMVFLVCVLIFYGTLINDAHFNRLEARNKK
jgi:hypothetical protein